MTENNDPVSASLPDKPELLLTFSVEITDEWQVEDAGVGFSAIVYGDNGASFAVENDGNGGCNRYLTFDTHGEDLLEAFTEASEGAYTRQVLEPLDLALLWIELRELIPPVMETLQNQNP
jgi:hypothetical protein